MKSKLGEILVKSGALTERDISAALSDQNAGEPNRLGELLVSLGKITPTQLGRALAQQHAIPFVELPGIPEAVLELVPIPFQQTHRLVPFRLDGDHLFVAMADPSNTDIIEDLKLQLKKKITVFVAAGDEIDSIHSVIGGEGPVVDAKVSLSSPSGVYAAPSVAPVPVPPAKPSSPKAPPKSDLSDLFSDIDSPVPRPSPLLSEALSSASGVHRVPPPAAPPSPPKNEPAKDDLSDLFAEVVPEEDVKAAPVPPPPPPRSSESLAAMAPPLEEPPKKAPPEEAEELSDFFTHDGAPSPSARPPVVLKPVVPPPPPVHSPELGSTSPRIGEGDSGIINLLADAPENVPVEESTDIAEALREQRTAPHKTLSEESEEVELVDDMPEPPLLSDSIVIPMPPEPMPPLPPLADTTAPQIVPPPPPPVTAPPPPVSAKKKKSQQPIDVETSSWGSLVAVSAADAEAEVEEEPEVVEEPTGAHVAPAESLPPPIPPAPELPPDLGAADVLPTTPQFAISAPSGQTNTRPSLPVPPVEAIAEVEPSRTEAEVEPEVEVELDATPSAPPAPPEVPVVAPVEPPVAAVPSVPASSKSVHPTSLKADDWTGLLEEVNAKKLLLALVKALIAKGRVSEEEIVAMLDGE